MGNAAADTSLAQRVWRAMFGYLMKSAPRRTRALARRGLTPNDSRALFSLDLREGRNMRSLADEWQCDPSNTTWIIDRLETLGLAERRAAADDRRVKLVALTPKGARTRTSLMREFYDPPPELAALDREELQALERILLKLVPADAVGSTHEGRPQQRPRRKGERLRSTDRA